MSILYFYFLKNGYLVLFFILLKIKMLKTLYKFFKHNIEFLALYSILEENKKRSYTAPCIYTPKIKKPRKTKINSYFLFAKIETIKTIIIIKIIHHLIKIVTSSISGKM